MLIQTEQAEPDKHNPELQADISADQQQAEHKSVPEPAVLKAADIPVGTVQAVQQEPDIQAEP